MKSRKLKWVALVATASFFISGAMAQNPIIRDQFSADPTARVFNGKVYLYPSHDIIAPVDKNLRKDWFCMEDYHVFSSENLTDWTDHGVIVTQTKVPWLTKANYDMWAPDCVFKNGKYYFYFPVGGKIGVATADKPEGPYTVLEQAVKGAGGIDPCVLFDKEGKAYIFTAGGRIRVAKLKDNLIETDGAAQVIDNLPTKGLIEGPFAFEHNGKYYLTYPHVENQIERLEYAMSDSPMGPYKFTGVIMDESKSGCWTNHQSIVQYKGQWYLFYHDRDYSPKFDKNRSVRADSLFFNADGTIRKVIPTLRGVGLINASKEIQIDRYSRISDKGVSIAFNDTTNTFKGWKTVFEAKDAWLQFNAVNFASTNLKSIVVRANSAKGGKIQIHLNSANGPVIANVSIPKGQAWQTIKSPVTKLKKGVQNLYITSADTNPIEIDWISFK
ncbi:glycoside hydrolase family 43 [Paludibacter propionicigenes WB4]|uniref:Glycoside hydrolase family 43 n=1 Tax=Paludibacter propionicigenes (strain DSM 17365 / JCM 13257 / WB4) TaxID=694427 RepID=E4T4Z9_PALPW|nr:family 43 glycosylhydrolase [Paludibacter propionicigenes]ADQ79793.1 glycoside hydrolase family 43 [Paludibacter propionicigenes WB4]